MDWILLYIKTYLFYSGIYGHFLMDCLRAVNEVWLSASLRNLAYVGMNWFAWGSSVKC